MQEDAVYDLIKSLQKDDIGVSVWKLIDFLPDPTEAAKVIKSLVAQGRVKEITGTDNLPSFIAI